MPHQQQNFAAHCWFWAILVFAVAACQVEERAETAVSRPNILVILVDDMGYSDLGCYGSEIATPNIDALAENGLRMTQFYNAARCCPSRASLLTGLYPHQAGMGHQNQDRGLPSYSGKINENATTMAEVLQQAGYTTYQVGKWHVGNEPTHWPAQKGFDQYLTLVEGAMSYFNQWPWAKGQDTLEMRYNGKAYRTPPDFFATDTFTDTAVAFIERHNQQQPFFMYLAHVAPHWPLHVKPEDRELYKGKYDVGWDSIRAKRYANMKNNGLIPSNTPLSARYATVPAWETLSDSAQHAWAERMELYAAVVHRLDLGIGKVMEALKRSGQFDHTLVLFLSDNGACQEDPLGPWIVYPSDGQLGGERSFPAYELPWANVSNTPYRYFKSFLHEGGIKTPFIAHWPSNIERGTIDTASVAHLIDLMPTVLELAETAYPEQIGARNITPAPGQSMVPMLKGENWQRTQPLFWEHQYNRAIREGDWKLVSAWKAPGEGKLHEWELYNLQQDPTELQNLAETHPEKVQELSEQYNAWAAAVGAYSKTEMDSLLKLKIK